MQAMESKTSGIKAATGQAWSGTEELENTMGAGATAAEASMLTPPNKSALLSTSLRNSRVVRDQASSPGKAFCTNLETVSKTIQAAGQRVKTYHTYNSIFINADLGATSVGGTYIFTSPGEADGNRGASTRWLKCLGYP